MKYEANQRSMVPSQQPAADDSEQMPPRIRVRRFISVAAEIILLLSLGLFLPVLRRIGQVDFWIVLFAPLWVYQLSQSKPTRKESFFAVLPSVWYLWLFFVYESGVPIPSLLLLSWLFIGGVLVGSLFASRILYRRFQGWRRVWILPLWLAVSLVTIKVYNFGVEHRYDWVITLRLLTIGSVLAGSLIASWILYRLFRGWLRVWVIPLWLAIVLATIHVVDLGMIIYLAEAQN